MRILPGAVLLAVLFLSACKEQKKSVPEDLNELAREIKKNSPGVNAGSTGFTIHPVEGWTKKDSSIQGLKYTFISSPPESASDRFLENLNVVTERCGPMSLDAYYEAVAGNLKNLPGFREEKLSDKRISGLEYKNLKYEHAYGGTPVQADLYITLKDNIAYLITCSTLAGEMGKWAPLFEEMVRSFSFQEPAK